MLQISIGTFTDGSRNLLHLVVSLGEPHHFFCLNNGKNASDESAEEADPVQLFHLSTTP